MPATAHFGEAGLFLILGTLLAFIWAATRKSCLLMMITGSAFVFVCSIAWDVTDCLGVNSNPDSTCDATNPLSWFFIIPMIGASCTLALFSGMFVANKINFWLNQRRIQKTKQTSRNQSPETD